MTTGSINVFIDDQMSWTKDWSGVNDPLKKNENPYSMTLTSRRNQKPEMWEFQPTPEGPREWVFAGRTWWTNMLAEFPPPLLALDPNLELAALAEIGTNIRGHDFNAGVFAAELPETLKMVIGTSRDVLSALVYLRRGNVSSAIRRLARSVGATGSRFGKHQQQQARLAAEQALKRSDVAGAWLALQYGWKPLISDIYEMMKAMEKLHGSSMSNRKVVFSCTKRARNKKPATALPGYTIDQMCLIKHKVIFRENLSATRSLGLADPLSVVWEKVPYSFVVDWFVPIGTYLSTLSFFGPLSINSLRTQFQRSSFDADNMNAESGFLKWLSGKQHTLNVSLVRTFGPVSIPKPSFKALAKAFSLAHLENGAALLSNLIDSTRQKIR